MPQFDHALAAALLVSATALACSSSSGTANSTGTMDPSTTETPPMDGNDAGMPASGGAVPSGSATDAGAASADASSVTLSPVCPAEGLMETEPNDTPDMANAIPGATETFCGSLPNAGDVDYVTFTLPADAKALTFGKAWNNAVIGLEVTVDGNTFTTAGPVIFSPGKVYLMKIWLKGPGTTTDYTVSIGITK